MRKELKKINNETRHTFEGFIEKFGSKKNYLGFSENTILIKNICCNNNLVAEHLWVVIKKTISKSILDFSIKYKEDPVGKKIIFQGRVKKYEKGYKGYDLFLSLEKPVATDYKISHITKIQILNNQN